MGSERVSCYWCGQEFPLSEVEMYVWDIPEKVRPEDEEIYRPMGWPERKKLTTYCCEACHLIQFERSITEKQEINNMYYIRKKSERQARWSK